MLAIQRVKNRNKTIYYSPEYFLHHSLQGSITGGKCQGLKASLRMLILNLSVHLISLIHRVCERGHQCVGKSARTDVQMGVS